MSETHADVARSARTLAAVVRDVEVVSGALAADMVLTIAEAVLTLAQRGRIYRFGVGRWAWRCGTPAHLASEEGRGFGFADSFEQAVAAADAHYCSAHAHWLVFDRDQAVVGCHCGFAADEADSGFGDSVVAHLRGLGPNG